MFYVYTIYIYICLYMHNVYFYFPYTQGGPWRSNITFDMTVASLLYSSKHILPHNTWTKPTLYTASILVHLSHLIRVFRAHH